MIDDIFYINLSIRPDREKQFLSSFPEELGTPIRIEAVHGDSCPHPAWWGAGAGAWGCYRSHLNLLEYCMSKNLPSYMVFEDDATFVPNFMEKYQAFINDLPPDCDMFYLGGQLMHVPENTPVKINENVYRPFNVNRTHCFAVFNSGYKYLYDFLLRRFEAKDWHIDHHLGRAHEQAVLNVYCSSEWLVGQREGSSNISGTLREDSVFFPSARFYHNTNLELENYCIVLFSPEEVARELTSVHHWHSGYSKNNDFIDVGLTNIKKDITPKLRKWYYYVKRESIERNLTPFLWHTELTKDLLSKVDLPFNPLYITANSVDEALLCLKTHLA